MQRIYLAGRIGPGFILELRILNFSYPIIIASTTSVTRRLFRLSGWFPQNGGVTGYAKSSAHQMLSRSYSQYYLYFDLLKKEMPNFLYSVWRGSGTTCTIRARNNKDSKLVIFSYI